MRLDLRSLEQSFHRNQAVSWQHTEETSLPRPEGQQFLWLRIATKDLDGNTALILAVTSRNPIVVQEFLESFIHLHIDFSHKNQQGNTRNVLLMYKDRVPDNVNPHGPYS